MNKYPLSFGRLSGPVVLGLTLMAFLASCSKQEMSTSPGGSSSPVANPVVSIPKAPTALSIPADNPMTAAKIELGRHLFFDKSLSVDKSTACGSCHQVANGFSDVTATSMGMGQQHGTRNAPALANVAYNTAFTWDGRFKSLEEHAPGPIFNSVEMGNNFSITAQDTVPNGYNSGPGPNDTNFLFQRIDGKDRGKFTSLDPYSKRTDANGNNYYNLFKAAWGSADLGPNGVSMDHIAKSIACFERTFITTQSDFDKYNNGDQEVLKNNPKALRGLQLFTDVNGANCISCHSGYNFTDQQFHDNGIGSPNDKGRANVVNDPSNIGKFKTPSLRNVYLTAPYMHDGRYATLFDVISKNYNAGGAAATSLTDSRIKKLNLSDYDITCIVEFLKTLTDDHFVTDRSNMYTNPWAN